MVHLISFPSINIPFNADQVRVLLYRECDLQGRRLLFDSSAIQKTKVPTEGNASKCTGTTGKSNPLPNGQAASSCRKKYTVSKRRDLSFRSLLVDIFIYFQYGRPSGDHNDIGEMVWGTAAMNFRGTSLKVHWLKQPPRILCSQIFLSPTTGAQKPYNGTTSPPINVSSTGGLDGTGSDISSLDTTSMSSFSGSFMDGSRGSFQMDPSSQHELRWSTATDSGVNSDSPWNTSMSTTTRSSLGSVYSTDQDFMGHRKTSIDSSIQSSDPFWVPGTGQPSQQPQHMQKRVLRCLSTSFENHNSFSDSIGVIGDPTTVAVTAGDLSRWRRNSEVIHNERLMSNPEMARRKASGETISIPFYSHGRLQGNGTAANLGAGQVTPSGGRRSKLGVAVCVTLHESLER